jgi:methyltransferase OMS1
MSSTLMRRAGFVATAAGTYVAATYLAYNYLTAGVQDQEETEQQLQQKQGFSFVDNPERNLQFQKVAATYDEQIGRDEAYMGINLLRRSLLYFHAKGTVLEVGAGTGRNLEYYPKSRVKRVVLSDTSDQMLWQAKQKLASMTSTEEKSRFACLEANAANLSQFPDSCFDTVVDTFGLCSYDDPVQVLNEMARVCKKEGKILLLEHGRSKSWDGLSQYLDKHAERHAKNWGCVWNRDLDEILEKAGLKLDKKSTWHFGTTYYVVCRPGDSKPANSSDTGDQIIATS